MRVLLAATIAAAVLAIGSSMEPAASLPLGGQGANPDAPVHKAQQMSPSPDVGGRKTRSGEKGMRDDGPRTGQRSRDWNGGDRERRRSGRGGIWFGPGYGFRPDCGWLRRRALDTGSPYWWRRYRACAG